MISSTAVSCGRPSFRARLACMMRGMESTMREICAGRGWFVFVGRRISHYIDNMPVGSVVPVQFRDLRTFGSISTLTSPRGMPRPCAICCVWKSSSSSVTCSAGRFTDLRDVFK